MAREGDPDRIERPDVEIGASVKAKSLRFREKPRTEVDFHGVTLAAHGPGLDLHAHVDGRLYVVGLGGGGHNIAK